VFYTSSLFISLFAASGLFNGPMQKNHCSAAEAANFGKGIKQGRAEPARATRARKGLKRRILFDVVLCVHIFGFVSVVFLDAK